MNNYRQQWEDSYKNRDNFLFYPNEEVIRFVSKYLRKRKGLDEFQDINLSVDVPNFLDLGCGVGRHIIFAYEMGFNPYGIDLSQTAIDTALQWMERRGITDGVNKVVQGDITKLPWSDAFFDIVVSHGVLDSMHFEVAKQAVKEVYRVLNDRGFFYCDLISGDDSAHSREFAGEEIVTTDHEKGTVQSYFNYAKICDMIKSYFIIRDAILVKRESILHPMTCSARYYLVLQKKVK